MPIYYETHLPEGAAFPYIFHSGTRIRTRRNDTGNRHTNMEILCITGEQCLHQGTLLRFYESLLLHMHLQKHFCILLSKASKKAPPSP